MKKLKDFNNEIEAREYFGEKPFDGWKKEWAKFVKEEMCPARCGHLRFKLKELIQKLLDKKEIEVEKAISKIEQIRCDEMLDKQRDEIIKLMANTPYMSPRALETLIIKIKTLNK